LFADKLHYVVWHHLLLLCFRDPVLHMHEDVL
jgi:hypothetical protein